MDHSDLVRVIHLVILGKVDHLNLETNAGAHWRLRPSDPLDGVDVADGGGIEEADLGELGDEGDFDAKIGGFRFQAAERLGEIEADAVGLVHVDHHTVGGAGAGHTAPLAGIDFQILALLGGDVVLQDVGEDGSLGIVGDLAGDQHAVLGDGDEDVIRQAVGGAVVIAPDGGQRPVDILEDFIGGFAGPLGAAAGARPGGGAHDLGVVAQACGIHL